MPGVGYCDRPASHQAQRFLSASWLCIRCRQSLTHADPVFLTESQAFVESFHRFIVATDLQVQLTASQRSQRILCLLHQCSGMTRMLVIRISGQAIDPASMTIKPGHDGGDDPAVEFGYPEEFRLPLKFQSHIGDSGAGIINESTALPEHNDRRLISLARVTYLRHRFAPPSGRKNIRHRQHTAQLVTRIRQVLNAAGLAVDHADNSGRCQPVTCQPLELVQDRAA